MITIRTETENDRESIRELTAAAFSASEHGHHGEAALVDTVRRSSSLSLSLVACAGTQVVGHILFSPVTIRTQNGDNRGGMGLGPMSVAPRRQKLGIGSLLVRKGMSRVFHHDVPFVVVLGDPNFYSRFGFEPASAYSVSHGFAGVPQDVFMMKSSSDDLTRRFRGGQAHYLEAFGPQFAHG